MGRSQVVPRGGSEEFGPSADDTGCPMLHVDPKMIVRLDEIEEDLLSRRRRAQLEGWLGEIEGIELTLKFLAGKRAEAQRTQRAAMTDIGMPGVGPPDP